MKDKNQSIAAENTFDKVQHPFMIKLSTKWVQKNIPQQNKVMHDECTLYMVLNDEKLKAFPFILEIRQQCPH